MKHASASSQWKVPLCVPTRVEKHDANRKRGLWNANVLCQTNPETVSLTIFGTVSTVSLPQQHSHNTTFYFYKSINKYIHKIFN